MQNFGALYFGVYGEGVPPEEFYDLGNYWERAEMCLWDDGVAFSTDLIRMKTLEKEFDTMATWPQTHLVFHVDAASVSRCCFINRNLTKGFLLPTQLFSFQEAKESVQLNVATVLLGALGHLVSVASLTLLFS